MRGSALLRLRQVAATALRFCAVTRVGMFEGLIYAAPESELDRLQQVDFKDHASVVPVFLAAVQRAMVPAVIVSDLCGRRI